MVRQDERTLEAALGTAFHDPPLLRLALVHRSFVAERPSEAPGSNERLEFLGDALLGLVIAKELFDRFPGEPEGRLTEMRARLVRGVALAEIAGRIGVGECLFLGRGEEATGGRRRQRNLAGALEAVLGAVFLDQGLAAAGDLVRRLFDDALATIAQETSWNYKSLLQEEVQAMGRNPPTYHTIAEEGAEHARTFAVEARVDGQVVATGRGASKQEAEQAAARSAYLLIKGQAV